MNAVLEAQRLALAATQQACARQPGVHAHQLLALQREQALCASAATFGDYQRAVGGGFELARAAWLDRVAGRFRVALSVDDHDAARAALLEYRGALAAPGLAGWTEALKAAALAAAPWHARSAQAGSSLTRTVLNLLLHHSCTPPMADHWGDAVGAWRTLCSADPAAARALCFGAAWPAGLAPRLPWREGAARRWLQRLLASLPAPPPAGLDEAQAGEPDDGSADADLATELAALAEGWARALHGDASVPPLAAPVPDPAGCPALVSAEQALAPWRSLAEPAHGAEPAALALADVARRLLALAAGAANGPEVQRCAIESGLLTELAVAPLRVRLAAVEQRQAAWPQPLLAAHARALRASLAQAGTATEAELRATHAEACLDVEADWQSLYFAAQGAPLVAALNFAIDPAEADRGLRGASAISRHLLGQAPAATLQGALVPALLQAHGQPQGQPHGQAHGHDEPADPPPARDSDDVAWRGEAGHGLLPLLRAWDAVTAARGAAMPPDSAGRLAALHRVAGACLDGTAPGTPVVVQLWGVRADAGQAAQLLAEPSRPAVPLGRAPGAAGDAV